jgi:serine/threonine protein kinase
MVNGHFSKYPVMFGRFRLLGEIGSGGMAVVYRAEMRSLRGFSKMVAVKILHMHLIENSEQRQLFFNEARLGGFLHHPNIVEIYDFNEQDKRYFLAMEFVNGPTFHQVLRAHRAAGHPVPLDVALQLMIQTCHGLDYAHKAVDNKGRTLKMVHRDLKPSNILVNQYGQVKIADFGVARAVSNINLTDTVASGMIKGTIRYLSPEQACSRRSLDHRSDLFAAGLILYEFLANRFFYEGLQQELILQMARQADIAGPLKLLPEMAFREQIIDLLTCALAPRQENRFDSGMEMAKAMEKILARLPRRTELTDWLRNMDRLKTRVLENNGRGSDDPVPSKLSESTELVPKHVREYFARLFSSRHESKPAGEPSAGTPEKHAKTCREETDPSTNCVVQDLKSSRRDWWNTPLNSRPDYSIGSGKTKEKLTAAEEEDRMSAMWRFLASMAKNPSQWDSEPGQNTITQLFNTPRHTLYDTGANIFDQKPASKQAENKIDDSSDDSSGKKNPDAAPLSASHFFRGPLPKLKNVDTFLKIFSPAGRQSPAAPTSNAADYIEQGWAAWRRGEYEEAVRQWDKAEAIDSELVNTSNGKMIKVLREHVLSGRSSKA